jgi:hypothetical protein
MAEKRRLPRGAGINNKGGTAAAGPFGRACTAWCHGNWREGRVAARGGVKRERSGLPSHSPKKHRKTQTNPRGSSAIAIPKKSLHSYRTSRPVHPQPPIESLIGRPLRWPFWCPHRLATGWRCTSPLHERALPGLFSTNGAPHSAASSRHSYSACQPQPASPSSILPLLPVALPLRLPDTQQRAMHRQSEGWKVPHTTPTPPGVSKGTRTEFAHELQGAEPARCLFFSLAADLASSFSTEIPSGHWAWSGTVFSNKTKNGWLGARGRAGGEGGGTSATPRARRPEEGPSLVDPRRWPFGELCAPRTYA